MKAYLVTGVAGFIGSTLAERLVRSGYPVIGVDCLTDYYSPERKVKNLRWLLHQRHFRFHREDLLKLDPDPLLKEVEGVFHLAGQPGVRSSWGQDFTGYLHNNILATQTLLESARKHELRKFVYASSSSVYGNCNSSVLEEQLCQPVSPYGVTKLAAEQLCYLYWYNYGVPTVSLRYFTVYGPRQRPDMAFYRFIDALLRDDPITIYGDGNQTRDFTYVDDVVEATIRAMESDVVGETFNIGGGRSLDLNTVQDILHQISGLEPHLVYEAPFQGDVQSTLANTEKARRLLGFYPRTCIEEGLLEQYLWQKNDS
ncbi:MAG: NAD-dependent epimerase/dehydratase family protein [Syntrophomonadaceae bacterium]|nr:NAD-dependent epimerase/dehydratase family protein [Syntrophomonadaceae bacterium]